MTKNSVLFVSTPGSKGCRELKTKVKNVAGMAVGPDNQRRMSRAKILLFVDSLRLLLLVVVLRLILTQAVGLHAAGDVDRVTEQTISRHRTTHHSDQQQQQQRL